MGQVKNVELIEQIARKVKKMRENAGVSQEIFYHDTGIHIGRIETAKGNITVSTLEAICAYFNTDIVTFFTTLNK